MILLIFALIIFVLKSLDFLYLFQIKEYRLDRILNFLKEEKLFVLLYLRRVRMPAISLRNLLIAQGIFFNILPLYLLLKNANEFQLTIFLLTSPLTAFISMVIGLLLSEIPVQIYRRLIIYRASRMVKNSKAIFIGITGSYGKTSTKEFLFQILAQKFPTAKTEKNYNSNIGVALSITKNLKPDTKFFISEIGAYRVGEIKEICSIIKPQYGILTGIGNQHISLFGSFRYLLLAKSELLEALPAQGMAYINQDIEDWRYFADKTKAKKTFYSVSKPADIYLTNLKQDDEITSAEIRYNDVKFEIQTKLLGIHNLQNLLPCIALAHDLGIDKNDIVNVINALKQPEHRLSLEKGINGSTVLNDSYNSNVDGFLAAIGVADKIKAKNKYIINRGLIELGKEKTASYQKIIAEINKSNMTLLTTDGFFNKLDSNNKVISFQNENQMLNYVKNRIDKNTLIVIEGRFEPKTIEMLCHSGLSRI